MKTIEVDEDLYRYIASQTLHIGESASDILRRLLQVGEENVAEPTAVVTQPEVKADKGIVVSKDAAQEHKVDSVKEMRSLLISDEFAGLKKAVDRFILVLSTLYRIDPASFSDAMSVKGRKRVYFADNEQTLLSHGQTTKPKLITNTPFWVITNNNTSRKQQMVEQVMVRMNFPADIIEKVSHAI
ncbi:replication initiation negative regulator SeqA [Vibrio sp. CAIM 722]|uniref:Negative modulator of initiation of replication n=1 Tax=Vibrio eleionomae TaxID=2653505 RepID=A0A7X4RT54_9VIBR|nr:replication initiation negative regulator SeqA [Vibrio eleionomae]MZI92093.1 replication initiation negative regulator SeqA [Vibrio eleionomae]